MGTQGVVVDGNVVMPSSRSGEPIILPLQDQAEFTIHNKSFKFEYPTQESYLIRLQVEIHITSIGFTLKYFTLY